MFSLSFEDHSTPRKSLSDLSEYVSMRAAVEAAVEDFRVGVYTVNTPDGRPVARLQVGALAEVLMRAESPLQYQRPG